jgi:prolyl-tRNA editing enzyme YbaK/EbsC (Cys-tRNA(Pro) deacylase)
MSSSAVLTNPSVERVRAALERAGMPTEIVELPGAARTAKAAADFLGCGMSSGACRVDLARLARVLGEPVAKADAEFVRRHTGFAIGGVAPVGHALSKVFVEKALAAQGELWAAAGHPHTVFRLSYPQLLSITGGREAELAA